MSSAYRAFRASNSAGPSISMALRPATTRTGWEPASTFRQADREWVGSVENSRIRFRGRSRAQAHGGGAGERGLAHPSFAGEQNQPDFTGRQHRRASQHADWRVPVPEERLPGIPLSRRAWSQKRDNSSAPRISSANRSTAHTAAALGRIQLPDLLLLPRMGLRAGGAGTRPMKLVDDQVGHGDPPAPQFFP